MMYKMYNRYGDRNIQQSTCKIKCLLVEPIKAQIVLNTKFIALFVPNTDNF